MYQAGIHKSKMISLKFLKTICIIGEVLTGAGLLLAVAIIPFSEAMVDSHRANIGIYVRHGAPDWSFKLRTGSGEGNFSFDRDPPLMTSPEYGNISFGPFRLPADESAYHLSPKNSESRSVVIDRFQGIVTFKQPNRAAQIMGPFKWPILFSLVLTGGLGLMILELLRRMFGNVEQGEAFTASNIRNLHKIGFSLIGYSIFKFLTSGWLLYLMTACVTLHVATGAQNIESTFDGGDFTGIGMGLLTLALAEVFYQGLALKEEARFTI